MGSASLCGLSLLVMSKAPLNKGAWITLTGKRLRGKDGMGVLLEAEDTSRIGREDGRAGEEEAAGN